jgi:NAD(P)-dependent dehydrogenase (short-subunit alcohol dehydrogenase family)
LHYAAAKAGVISLTNNLACMWAKHNINVNCILPGMIATDELKRYGIIPSATDKHGNAVPRLERTPNPENVADLALFLASPASDALTGELYPIRAWLKSERFWQ